MLQGWFILRNVTIFQNLVFFALLILIKFFDLLHYNHDNWIQRQERKSALGTGVLATPTHFLKFWQILLSFPETLLQTILTGILTLSPLIPWNSCTGYSYRYFQHLLLSFPETLAQGTSHSLKLSHGLIPFTSPLYNYNINLYLSVIPLRYIYPLYLFDISIRYTSSIYLSDTFHPFPFFLNHNLA